MLENREPTNEFVTDYFKQVTKLLVYFISLEINIRKLSGCCIVVVFYFYTEARNWVSLFTSLGGICDGYMKSNVTPYMHVMVYHIPHAMRLHGGIKKFTGQGMLVTLFSRLTYISLHNQFAKNILTSIA